MIFNRIAVIGLGLISGSICRGVKKYHTKTHITAYGRSIEKLQIALDDRIVDEIKSMDEIDLNGVDLIIVGTPVISSVRLIQDILSNPGLGSHTLVIDVGSVKGPVISGVIHLKNSDRFIGCHPMTGSHETGYEASRDDLLEHAVVFVTPWEKNRNSDVIAVAGFWESLKSKVKIIPSHVHDRAVTFTSHLPHIMSCLTVKALIDYLEEEKDITDIRPFIGRGFMDTTRVSAGSPDMWIEITAMNSGNIIQSLKDMSLRLNELAEVIDGGARVDTRDTLHAIFHDIRSFRVSLNE